MPSRCVSLLTGASSGHSSSSLVLSRLTACRVNLPAQNMLDKVRALLDSLGWVYALFFHNQGLTSDRLDANSTVRSSVGRPTSSRSTWV